MLLLLTVRSGPNHLMISELVSSKILITSTPVCFWGAAAKTSEILPKLKPVKCSMKTWRQRIRGEETLASSFLGVGYC